MHKDGEGFAAVSPDGYCNAGGGVAAGAYEPMPEKAGRYIRHGDDITL